MMTAAVISAISIPLRKRSQRHVTAPVPPEPVVDEPVERQQRHAQEQVLLVGGIPELRPIGQLDHEDEQQKPARPDGDPGCEQHHVRVGADGPENAPAQLAAEHGRASRPPPQPALGCGGDGTRSAETVLWHQ